MHLKFTFHGDPVPAQRVRVTQQGTYTPNRYRKYKADLTAALKAEFPHLIRNLTRVERSKALRKERYALSLIVYRAKATGDIDNYLKTVMDALEQSGIILNDKQITESHQYLCKGLPPRIQFDLKELKQ